MKDTTQTRARRNHRRGDRRPRLRGKVQFDTSLKQGGALTVVRSLWVDKDRITLATLIAALVYDRAVENNPKIPILGEERKGALQDLIRRAGLLL